MKSLWILGPVLAYGQKERREEAKGREELAAEVVGQINVNGYGVNEEVMERRC